AVENTAFRFPCEPNESVLDAAQRAGLEIPFSCRKGVCGTCMGRVVAGEVRAYAGDALSAAERAEGQALFCNARPASDLVIPPAESDGAQLHIRHVPGGAFTSYVFEKLQRGDRLKLEVPFGDFILRDSDKAILFVAGSTGFAPIRSIIEDMLTRNIRRGMTLY